MEIEGLKELNAALMRALTNFPKERDRFLAMEGELVLGRTKAKTPVDTGRLRFSWQRSAVVNGEVEIGNNTEYAPYVEFGHRIFAWGKFTGRVKAGKFMLRDSIFESKEKFQIDAAQILARLIK